MRKFFRNEGSKSCGSRGAYLLTKCFDVNLWLSTFIMHKRSLELKEPVCNIDDREIEKLVSTFMQYRRNEKMWKKFAVLDFVTHPILLFDSMLKDYPNMSCRLRGLGPECGKKTEERGSYMSYLSLPTRRFILAYIQTLFFQIFI